MDRWIARALLCLALGCTDKDGEQDDDGGLTLGTMTSGSTGSSTGTSSTGTSSTGTSSTGGTAGSSTTGGTSGSTGSTGGTTLTDADGDGFHAEEDDCDDGDAAVNPDAAEVCNGADDNCDGAVDEGVTIQAWADVDRDGYGDDDAAAYVCEGVVGYAEVGGDCDDSDASVSPGEHEACGDEADNDCDGAVDESCSLSGYATFDLVLSDAGPDVHNCFYVWEVEGEAVSPGTLCSGCEFGFDVTWTFDQWAQSGDDGTCGTETGESVGTDQDAQYTFGHTEDYYGYGPALLYHDYGSWYALSLDSTYDPAAANWTWGIYSYTSDYTRMFYSNAALDGSTVPVPTFDTDGDGYDTSTDCDDLDPDINPAALEVCDGVDNDCDGDESGAIDAATFYIDDDGDGWGDDTAPLTVDACEAPSGYGEAGDCDDSDSDVSPDAREVCDDLIDNDCNGFTDIDCSSGSDSYDTWEGYREWQIEIAGWGDYCDFVWTTEGSPSSSSCSTCDFVFEVDAYDGTDLIGNCGDYGDWLGMELGYDPDYGGDEMVLYGYGGTFYPVWYASLSADTLYYWYDRTTTYYSYVLYYDWYGEAELSYTGSGSGSTSHPYSAWVGEREVTVDVSGSTLCDWVWSTEGTPSSSSCSACDFVFEVDAYDGIDNAGACGDYGDWLGEEFGYTADYYGYGEMVLMGYGGTFYPQFYASLVGYDLSYQHSWSSYYDYAWYGSALLVP